MKLKKILASALAAAMALTTMAVTSFAADTELSTSHISYSDLQKYDTLTVYYTQKSISECGHEVGTGEGKHAEGSAYCNWGCAVFIGSLVETDVAISDSKKTDWYQPNSVVQAASYADVAETSATVKVSDIINSFTSDSDWNYTLSSVMFSTWNGATITKVVGTSSSSGEEQPPADNTSTVLWEGSSAFENQDWSSPAVQIAAADLANLSAGSNIKITYTVGCAGAEYQQFTVKVPVGNWDILPSFFTASGDAYGIYQAPANGSTFSFTIAESDIETVKTNGIAVQGYNVTVTKVEIISASTDGGLAPEEPKPEEPKPEVGNTPVFTVVPNVISSVTIPANSATKFEITDPVTGKTIFASVNKLAKALSRITEGSALEFDTGSFGLVLRKNVIQEIVDNDLTLVINTSKATFIIDAENLAKVKTINIPAIMKTTTFNELIKEGDTFNVIVTEKNKVEIELA